MVSECQGLIGKRVVSGREGEWRAHQERRDRSFDVRVVGVTNRQISLMALRTQVRAVMRGKDEWLAQGLEETRAGTFFAKCASAEQRERACATFSFLSLAGYAYATPAHSCPGATAAPSPSAPATAVPPRAGPSGPAQVWLQPQPALCWGLQALSMVCWQRLRRKGWG